VIALANLVRLYQKMAEGRFDVVIAATPANVAYLSDYRSESQWTGGAHAFVVISSDRHVAPTIILPKAELYDFEKSESDWIREVKCYGAFFIEGSAKGKHLVDSETPLAALLQCLRDIRLDNGKIGVDEDGFHGLELESLRKDSPNAKLEAASDLFRETRIVKTREEVAQLTKSSHIVESAISETLKSAKLGMKGDELVRKFNRFVIEFGGFPVMTTIGLGKKGYLQSLPPKKKIVKGDILRFDVGCVYNNYCSDIARTAIIGKPARKCETYYSALFRGQKAALKSIRPGRRVSEVFNVAVETVRKSGIPHYTRHHCGHGIGVELYEPPKITMKESRVLEEDMVLCVETPYYEVGFGGLSVEDMVLVTQPGFKYLTSLSRELFNPL